MINIRKDLIEQELERDTKRGYIYHKFNLHNKFINKLLNHYYCHEMCENWYDSEPNVDEYISDMAYMYEYGINGKIYTKEYIKEKYNIDYTIEEAKRCSIERDKIYKKYNNSERRLTFNNWQDPYGEGIWGMSQKEVDKLAYDTFKSIQKFNVSKKDRLYISYKDDEIRIYFYGRDFNKLDYWFIFEKRDRRIK
jgi:hypothetical protein